MEYPTVEDLYYNEELMERLKEINRMEIEGASEEDILKKIKETKQWLACQNKQ